ncbi:MAG: zinc-ribbon domain-containing protein [Blastocatellia bacterium]
MTYQCMQCGSQTRAGAKFCHQCGTPIATTSLPPTMPFAAPPPTAETQPQAFEAAAAPRTAAATEAMPASTAYISQMPQTYQAPMPVPMLPQKSRSGFKIVMITLAIIFAFGIASVIGAAFFIKNQVQQNAQKIFKTNPASVPDDQLGVPPYPMAKRVSTKPVLLARTPASSLNLLPTIR